jgi:hypothetical protein
MATAKDFVARVDQVDGVTGCLLIKENGVSLGQTLDDVDTYTSLLLDSVKLSNEVMEKTGFSYCRHISFQRSSEESFYIFPIKNYLLGVLLNADCSEPVMLEQVARLINRVSVGGSVVDA